MRPKYDLNEYQMTMNAWQHERSQLYFYLQQKSDESLNYYNEIQRLNALVVDLNKDLIDNKEKYQTLENELNLGKDINFEERDQKISGLFLNNGEKA
jgi:hypothetical protein